MAFVERVDVARINRLKVELVVFDGEVGLQTVELPQKVRVQVVLGVRDGDEAVEAVGGRLLVAHKGRDRHREIFGVAILISGSEVNVNIDPLSGNVEPKITVPAVLECDRIVRLVALRLDEKYAKECCWIECKLVQAAWKVLIIVVLRRNL